MLRIPFVTLALLVGVSAQDARRHGADSPDRGLPTDPAAFRPYSDRPGHVLNRVFRLLWTEQLTPSEVAGALPGEGPVAVEAGWVHAKRKGRDGDGRWFGGDGRQLPLNNLSDDAAKQLRELLPMVGAEGRDALAADPRLAVLFQHDLLRAAQRLADLDQQPDLLPLLLDAARDVALDTAELERLGETLRPALAEEAVHARFAADLPSELGGTGEGFRELLRRSTRLFDAERTLQWSRVWLRHPDGTDALQQLLPAKGDATPTVPIGMAAVLVQGVVAMDRDGNPCATPVVVDVRIQKLVNRDPLSADNPTFTRDGIDFSVLQLEREGLRRGDATRWFREVMPDDQDLFRDYGTAKHTTYRGQCSLCHRNTDTPEPELGGVVVLRPHAEPRFASTGEERLRLAEQQAAKLLAKLKATR